MEKKGYAYIPSSTAPPPSLEAFIAASKKQSKKKLIEPPKPLSEEAWKALSPKAKWDSTVALRGPDFTGSDALKWFTSSVIRYKLSQIMRVGGLVNSSLPFVVIPQRKSETVGKFDAGHFLGHILEAAAWLGIEVVYANTEASKAMLGGSGSYHDIYALLRDDPSIPLEKRLYFGAKESADDSGE